MGRVWRLRIMLDDKYPKIIDRCRQAIEILMPGQRAATLRRSCNCTEVSLYSKHWPYLIPQHGPGRKHLRPIRLEPWQEVLVKQATEDFICGLIDSDGCRVVANDRGVRSVRYHFSNRSEDILGLFTGALDQLGIPWTRSSRYVIAIYTARLQSLVSTSSSDPRREVHQLRMGVRYSGARYLRGVSTTGRRRPALVALVVVAALGCLALGWWQWTRFQSASGSFQNLGYALQWPLFAWFCVYAYRKFVRYEETPPEPHKDGVVTELPAGLLPERPQLTKQSDDDPALREYNAYLAELAKKDAENQNRTTA